VTRSPLHGITRPTLLVDENKVRRNIARMVDKARQSKVRLRPHFKTHQSQVIGRWFREAGIEQITVSSLEMAEYFAADGWRDITIAIPCNVAELQATQRLAQQVELGILVDTTEALAFLLQEVTQPLRVWIKIDVGYGRAGVHWTDKATVEHMVRMLTSEAGNSTTHPMRFAGLLTHAGHSYAASSAPEIQEITQTSLERMQSLQRMVESTFSQACPLSVGDTPSCASLLEFSGVDEVRPGNFVFHDVMQLNLGACRSADIAVAVACPVIARYPQRHEVLIQGGAAHFSKEILRPTASLARYELPARQAAIYGLVVGFDKSASPATWGEIRPDAVLTSLSQEHGILKVADSFWENCPIGQPLLILPVHSCLTADLFPAYISLQGNRLERRRTNDPASRPEDYVV